jgi:pilus assembly protein CpaE
VSAAPLLLLTKDPTVEKIVAAVRPGAPLHACRDSGSLSTLLAEGAGRVVLVDLEPDTQAALVMLADVAARFPEARFVVLVRELSPTVLLDAMQAGARHGIRRDTLEKELPAVMQRFGIDGAVARGGHVATVLSASGGAGCTTVAISLAEELRLASGSRVLLADLDVHYGAAAAYLGVHGTYGIADVINRKGTVDAELVNSSACAYDLDFGVLISPAAVNPSDPQRLDWARVPELINACRQAVPYTVFDASRVPPDVAADLARASSLTLLIIELAVVDIRTAKAMLQSLQDRNAGGDVVPVANRWSRRLTSPDLQDARDALGREVLTISNDFTAALRALNHGEPVARSSPRSPLREDVRQLAARITPTASVAAPNRGF